MQLISRRFLAAALVAAGTVSAVPAHAQFQHATRVVQVGFENDLIAVRGPGVPDDYDYTSGLRFSMLRSTAPSWLRELVKHPGRCDADVGRHGGCVATGAGVMQQIYTPRQNSSTPVPGERPYAGWLFGSLDMTLVSPGRSRTFGVDAGVTGPMSFAERVQNGLHHLLDNTPKLGWKDQVANAPGLVVRYDEGLRGERARGRAVTAVDLHWGAATGNIVNALTVGAEVSVGLRASLPWSPAEPRIERPTRAYLFVAYQQDAVLQSVLIEGRDDAPGAARRPLVGQVEAGLGYRHRLFNASYRHVVRGREYEAQLSPHAYGSLTISANLY